MRPYKNLIYVVSACLLILLAGCRKEQLTCNYATADISTTEEEHVVLAGFAARHSLSTTVHLPLKTHCLVIAKGAEKVCIISNDLMEISPREADRMRNEIANRTGMPVGHVLLHCTHTHSARVQAATRLSRAERITTTLRGRCKLLSTAPSARSSTRRVIVRFVSRSAKVLLRSTATDVKKEARSTEMSMSPASSTTRTGRSSPS